MAKLFKKFAGKPREKTTARVLKKVSILLENAKKTSPVVSVSNNKHFASPETKASPPSVLESQQRTTAPKQKEPAMPRIEPKHADKEVFDEVSSCFDLLRDIDKKMSKY